MSRLLCILVGCVLSLSAVRATTTTIFDSISGAGSPATTGFIEPLSTSPTGSFYSVSTYSSFSLSGVGLSATLPFDLQSVSLVLVPDAYYYSDEWADLGSGGLSRQAGQGVLSIELFANGASGPGSYLETLGTVSDAYLFSGTPDANTTVTCSRVSGPDGAPIDTCSFPTSYSLNPTTGTTYWIGVVQNSLNTPSTSGWIGTGYLTGTGVSTGDYYDAVAGFSGNSDLGGALEMQVMGSEQGMGNLGGDAAPEPSTLCLGILGLGAVALIRRRLPKRP